MACFIDTDVNSFRAEVLVLRKDKSKPHVVVDSDTKLDKGDFWRMVFDGIYCKDGSRLGIIIISPTRIT